MEPETGHARTGGIAIAYQVVGGGSPTSVYVSDYMSTSATSGAIGAGTTSTCGRPGLTR